MKTKLYQGLMRSLTVFFFLIIIVCYGFLSNQPPKVVGKDAPAHVFSAERAMEYMPHIAAQPHSLGSVEHLKVRNYLLDVLQKLGTEPELQMAEVYSPEYFKAATVGNIIVRLRGTNSSKAVLIMGHYDSVNHAFGASDDGSAIVTMLETLRLLKSQPPLKNDVIFLFTDGEEDGLLGAEAFLAQHPLAKEIGLILNFEASGTKGQSLMFETSANNNWLIKEFANAAPYPAANSLSYEIYRYMPNDTDLTPFKENGYQGLNFAYIDNRFDYHTDGDNIANTSVKSIQHHGSYAAALVKHFGNIDLNQTSEGNAVYFNTIGNGFVHYSYKWVIPFMVLTVLLLIMVLFLGFNRKLLKAWQLVFGFLASIIHLVIAPLIVTALYFILSKYYPAGDFMLLYYNHKILLLGFAGITIAISFLFYNLLLKGVKMWHVAIFLTLTFILLIWSGQISIITAGVAVGVSIIIYFLFRKPTGMWELALGALITFAILMGVVCILVPGGSYLITWPLFFSLIPIAYYFLKNSSKSFSPLQIGLFIVGAVPALLWLSSLSLLFLMAMGLKMAGGAILFSVLCLSLLIPHIQIITKTKAWIIPSLAFSVGIIFLLVGSVNLHFNERYQKGNSLVYTLNGNSNQTGWASFDKSTDEWTSQFLSTNPDTIQLEAFFPYSQREYLLNTTELELLPVPNISVLNDSTVNTARSLKLYVETGREAGIMYIQLKSDSENIKAGINKSGLKELRKVENSDWYLIRYFGFPFEGINLYLELETNKSVEIRLNDMVIGLPDFLSQEQKQRPEYMMPNGDRSMVTKSFFY